MNASDDAIGGVDVELGYKLLIPSKSLSALLR
jgi:hypothetical protein